MTLPYVGGYQVPVNRPLFYTDPTPNDPLFYSVHTQWPPFFHFCIKFYIKIANFCALRAHFEKFNNFVAILTENLQILPWNFIFAHWMTPIFGSPHQKKPPFFGAHTEWPLFWTKSYTERPLFSFSNRHLYVTFIFECPPPCIITQIVQRTKKWHWNFSIDQAVLSYGSKQSKYCFDHQ